MKEHKTVVENTQSVFDDAVNQLCKDGWEVVGRTFTYAQPPQNYDIFVAFLSREVPTVSKEETVQETPPSAGGNPTKDQYWECWKKAVGTEVGGADYLRFLSWYKTLNSDNHGN